MKKFTGLIPPMVTPLATPGKLDVASTKKMVRHLLAGWRFSTLANGDYALTFHDVRVISRLGQVPGRPSALGVGMLNVHWGKARCNSWLTRDFDGDGRIDLLMNGSKNVVLWTQVAAADGAWTFRREGEFSDQKLAAHSTCPTVCDFDGDGIADLVLGVEDGYLYHFRNPRSR